MPYTNTSSTITLQKIVNIAKTYGDIAPIFNVAGSTEEPALTIANDILNEIYELPFPHKWNEIVLPVFYTNSYQQDYALITSSGASVTNLCWLERGVAFDINSSALPKPFREVEVGRQLPQQGASYWSNANSNPLFLANWYPNNMLYYGTWGETNTGNYTLGNNPVAGSVYTNPLGANSQPSNPITQIQDANGNYLVLTTYGTEGSSAPLAAANATPGTTVSGTGASTVWTVVDPYGQGIRLLPVPNQTGVVWQVNLVGQMNPVVLTSLSQTLAPMPDWFVQNFRNGFIAKCYEYSPEAKVYAKFKDKWALWLRSLENLRSKQDREQEENMFVPDRGLFGGGNRTGWAGPKWPFNGPPW